MHYLDHNATSPLLPEVFEAMKPWFGRPANPSSVHAFGRAAHAAVSEAAGHVAALVGGKAEGVVFTSGATEANHLFLHGAARKFGGALAYSAIEHPCVAAAAAWWPRAVEVPVDAEGRAILDLPPDVTVLSLMAANHETGVIQPLAEARRVAPVLHVDATQGTALDLHDPDAITLSAHKLGGPQGTGALVLRDTGPFPALFDGSQQRGRRGGTVNVAGAVGFGEACRLALTERAARHAAWAALKRRLIAALVAHGARVVGGDAIPGTTCVVFPGLRGDGLVMALDLRGIAVSSGAACASGSQEPSKTLTAMGDPEPWGALRVSFGPRTEGADVDALLAALPDVLAAARAAASWDP